MGVWLNLAARALLRPPVDVAPERCLRSRLAASDCHRCVDVCPAEALRLESRGVRLEPLLCEGCGLCQGACWNAALTLRQAQTPQVAALAEVTGEVLRLTCSGGDEKMPASVPCLGALDPGRLAEAAAGRVLHLSPRRSCADCRWSKGQALLNANIEVARRSLTGMKIPGEIRLEQPAESSTQPESAEPLTPAPAVAPAAAVDPAPAPAAASRPVDRRELFQNLTGGLARSVARMLPADEKDWPDVGQRLRLLADRWRQADNTMR